MSITSSISQPGSSATPVSGRGRRRRRGLRTIWFVPLVLLYVIGGGIQYFGLITPTKCTVLTLLAFLLLLKRHSFWRTARHEWPLAVLAGYFVVAGFLHGTPSSSTAVYLYYSACLMLAAPAGRMFGRELREWQSSHKTRMFVISGLLFELGVTALQHIYAPDLAAHAAFNVGAEDAIYGTFYLASDATLAACCLLAVLVYSCVTTRTARVFAVACIAMGVIFLGHSRAMQGASLAIVPSIIGLHVYGHAVVRRWRVVLTLATVGTAAVVLPLSWQLMTSAAHDFAGLATAEYAARGDWITAGRVAPIGQLLEEPVRQLLFGHGALTYYNPITKQWLYNSGFSTLYGLSIDFGITGLMLYLAYQIRTFVAFSPSWPFVLLLLTIWIPYVAFNDILSNVELIFALNVSLSFVVCAGGAPVRYKGGQAVDRDAFDEVASDDGA